VGVSGASDSEPVTAGIAPVPSACSFWWRAGSARFTADAKSHTNCKVGAHFLNDPLTKQKDNIGVLRKRTSQGKGLFLMAERLKEGLSVSEQVRRKITSSN